MYEQHYHMQYNAFPVQPTPAVFYESSIHRGAMRFLSSGIEERENFILVTGEYGMGKTLLCMQLVKRLQERDTLYVYFPSPPSFSVLLRAILKAYGVDAKSEDEEELKSRLLSFFEDEKYTLRHCAIVLDEAQDAQMSTMSNLRLLSNFNFDGVYPLQLVFFAHPSIEQLLHRPALQPLNQRLRRRYQLKSLPLDETKEYIYFRLIKAGAHGKPFFEDAAISLIHKRSHGIPRCINNICDGCLLLGAVNDLDVIGADVVREAVASLNIDRSLDFGAAPESEPPAVAASGTRNTAEATVNPSGSDSAEKNAEDETEEVAVGVYAGHSDDEEGGDGDEARRSDVFTKYAMIVVAVIIGLAIAGAVYSSVRDSFERRDDSSGVATDEVGRRQLRQEDSVVAVKKATEVTSSAQNTTANSGRVAVEKQAVNAAPSEESNDDIYRGSAKNLASLLLSGRDYRQSVSDVSASSASSAVEKAGDASKVIFTPLSDGASSEVVALADLNFETATSSAGNAASIIPADVRAGGLSGDHAYSLLMALCSTRAEAESTAARLRENAVDRVYTTPILDDGHPAWWAVYQGAYDSGAQARRMKGVLGAPEAIISETPYALAIQPNHDFAATDLAGMLKENGYGSYRLQLNDGGDSVLLAGAFSSKDEAAVHVNALKNRGIDAVVIRR